MVQNASTPSKQTAFQNKLRRERIGRRTYARQIGKALRNWCELLAKFRQNALLYLMQAKYKNVLRNKQGIIARKAKKKKQNNAYLPKIVQTSRQNAHFNQKLQYTNTSIKPSSRLKIHNNILYVCYTIQQYNTCMDNNKPNYHNLIKKTHNSDTHPNCCFNSNRQMFGTQPTNIYTTHIHACCFNSSWNISSDTNKQSGSHRFTSNCNKQANPQRFQQQPPCIPYSSARQTCARGKLVDILKPLSQQSHTQKLLSTPNSNKQANRQTAVAKGVPTARVLQNCPCDATKNANQLLPNFGKKVFFSANFAKNVWKCGQKRQFLWINQCFSTKMQIQYSIASSCVSFYYPNLTKAFQSGISIRNVVKRTNNALHHIFCISSKHRHIETPC